MISYNGNDDYVFIRKFGTVADFVAGVKSLDTVLENIASFSAEVRQINNQDTPMAVDVVD